LAVASLLLRPINKSICETRKFSLVLRQNFWRHNRQRTAGNEETRAYFNGFGDFRVTYINASRLKRTFQRRGKNFR
jgi:hypothetical protein